jgi:hypothetical protein
VQAGPLELADDRRERGLDETYLAIEKTAMTRMYGMYAASTSPRVSWVVSLATTHGRLECGVVRRGTGERRPDRDEPLAYQRRGRLPDAQEADERRGRDQRRHDVGELD